MWNNSLISLPATSFSFLIMPQYGFTNQTAIITHTLATPFDDTLHDTEGTKYDSLPD